MKKGNCFEAGEGKRTFNFCYEVVISSFIMFYFLFVLLFSLPSFNTELTLHIIYSEVRPFVYKNKHGDIDGIIPKQYELGTKICGAFLNDTFHLIYVRGDSYNVFYENLFQKNLTIIDIFAAKNITNYEANQLKQSDHVPFFFPLFNGDYQNSANALLPRTMVGPELLKSHQIAIIMRRRHISLIVKAINSVFSSSSLLFFLLFFIAMFTMILTIAENCHNFSRNIPVSIVLKNAWYTFVTSTTVGYGDRCPTTKIGKFVGFFWIGISLILICIFTASISGSVLGDIDTEFEGKKISVLFNSYAADIVSKNYPKSEIVPKKLYEDVIDSVVKEDVMAGVLNADYAAWVQEELREQSVHIVQLLDYDISINGLALFHKKVELLYHCMQENKKNVIERPVLYFRKECEAEKIFYDSVGALYKSNWYLPALTIVMLTFMISCMAYELVSCEPALKKTKGQVEMEVEMNEIVKVEIREDELRKRGRELEKCVFSVISDIEEIKGKLNETKLGISIDQLYY